jgi:cytidylate kinase
MAIITISRQLGSWGNLIAKQVATRLGYRMVERELINQAALRAGAPEVGLAMIDDLHLLGLTTSPEAAQAYCEAVKCVMQELAEEGKVVIVGRAGQAILAARPDVLHVRVIAPLEVRAQRISERRNVTLQAARAQVEASDRSRRNYLKRYYSIHWENPELYDLVINTARFTLEDSAELIVQAFKQRFPTHAGNPTPSP